LPQLVAIPSPAQIRPDDVQPEKAEAAAIANHRDARDRLSVAKGEQKPFWIGCIEALRVGQTGVPALLGCPLQGKVELAAARRSNEQVR
jgi:hypothetical protein